MMFERCDLWLLVVTGLIVLNMSRVTTAVSLPRLNVKRDLVTVSGFSSGGTMAQHMQIAYSSIFKGVSTISHAFYRCGPTNGNTTIYDDFCTALGNVRISEIYDPAKALVDIQTYASLGIIDDPRNLANKPLYVFAGSTNFIFTLQQSLGALRVFQPFINNKDVIKIRVEAANLTLPSDRKGFPDCAGPQNNLFIGSCGFSAAFEGLEWLLGKRYVKAPSPSVKLQPLMEFDQTEFFFGFTDALSDAPALDSIGYFYIPKICKKPNRQCLLHFYFHGCGVGREMVGPSHILSSGYLEVAEANGIIMIFPQCLFTPLNPAACWDTFGFTGPLYATQKGAQVTVVKNMLDRIIGPDEGLEEMTTTTTASPVLKHKKKKVPSYQVSPELLRSYDDAYSAQQSQSYKSPDGRQCTLTRVSPDTVVKRCSFPQ